MKIQLKSLPQKPGAYLFKNEKGQIIYIGKAKNLKNRISSYFQKSATLSPAKQIMTRQVKKTEYIITDSELEALYLESNLIKKHRPKYNIDLKDDKNFVYIKIDGREKFPRLETARQIDKREPKVKYFGPYLSLRVVKETLGRLRKIFPYRTCKALPQKPCLLYQMGRCLGPCINKVSEKEYQKMLDQIVNFLSGNYEDVLASLKNKMQTCAQKREFEKAANLRDQIFLIKKANARQKIISPKKENMDLISLSQEENLASVNLFQVREGKLIGKKNFLLKNVRRLKKPELLSSFLEQYYPQVPYYPKEIILPFKIKNKLLEKLTSAKIIIPQKGRKRKLLKLGQENAQEFLERNKAIKTQKIKVLVDLKKELKLKELPRRIEGYDISNIQGQEAVGSMVVFENGQSSKSDYRKFKIKTVSQPDDYAMMAEVISRRMKHLGDWPRPQLILIDGGKGHLGEVRKTLKKLKLQIPSVALAKKKEEIFTSPQGQPLILKTNSPVLHLLQRIRDEAHRFAQTYYRLTHQKKLDKSKLDEVPGLGPQKRKALLKEFGSLEKIEGASLKKLTSLLGPKMAQKLKNYLSKNE